jgi:predicted DNA-binding helix-hairpin-helix protein
MGAQRTTFSKLQRDRAKKAKAALKRERRQERAASAGSEPELDVGSEGELSAAELLQLVESIHRSYEAKQISYEEYEEKKADLLSRLPVD